MVNFYNEVSSGGFNDGAIVRYNVSQNDSERVFQFSGLCDRLGLLRTTRFMSERTTHLTSAASANSIPALAAPVTPCS
jgi:hypothetical protein